MFFDYDHNLGLRSSEKTIPKKLEKPNEIRVVSIKTALSKDSRIF